MLIRCRENMLSQLGANLPSQPPGTLAARQGILGWGWREPRASHYPGLGAAVSWGSGSRKDQGGSLKGPASLPPGVPLGPETQATVSRPLILGMCILKPGVPEDRTLQLGSSLSLEIL